MAEKKTSRVEQQEINVVKRHVVFGESDVTTLIEAIKLDAVLEGEVHLIRDDLMVGPLENLENPEGYEQRRSWWQSLLQDSPYNTTEVRNTVDDVAELDRIKNFLNEDTDAQLWIWAGQNAHDVCGYFWLLSQLSPYMGRIYIVYLNNLPFINEKGGIFYPSYLHQILPKEFIKAKVLARKITPSEFDVDTDEWKKLCTENKMIRILEGGKKIAGKESGFFDADILANLTSDYQKGHRAMHHILGKMKIKTGDVFLLHRMRALQAAGAIDLQGKPSKGWKEFEIKLKRTILVTQENTSY